MKNMGICLSIFISFVFISKVFLSFCFDFFSYNFIDAQKQKAVNKYLSLKKLVILLWHVKLVFSFEMGSNAHDSAMANMKS